MAGNKTVKYSLVFDADTSKAKTQVQSLFNQLNKMNNTRMTWKTFDFNKPIGEAVQQVTKLQVALKQATNVDTGKLNFHQFNAGLAATGTSLQKMKSSIGNFGVEGRQAFVSLTKSLAQADTSVIKTSKLFNGLKRSLVSTIGWQFSSSAIHGFMGAIQGAMTYAKDLDKSLNNIRIVTGQSKDQMAEFAKNANKSAQALSTSTKAYTEAALIFYQQGLDDDAVKERTDTTMKMVTVTGESASEVSSYMTAIWNNFDDGSKSLEYYADVLTKLGASTAASTKEIAGGLEKFAAVADTVGLSYEYATAALTTIIDKTRQSEDVVGTALKTIFARIQGLQQGEEQDDGVTLNKYSKALANVGVQIIDNNGELKEMDKILDEMGAKWGQLGKAEQVALAQTVGGTRQYQQVIALMDNWGSVQDNINIAEMSEGSLQEQADIYAESWEGSQKRVKAATEEIYQSLIDSDFFIGLNNIFADLIGTINDFIKALGGAPGLLALTGNLLTNLFSKEIAAGFNGLLGIFNNITGKTKQLQENAIEMAKEMANSMGNSRLGDSLKHELDLYKAIEKTRKNLNEYQQIELDRQTQIYERLQETYQQENQRTQDSARALRTHYGTAMYDVETATNQMNSGLLIQSRQKKTEQFNNVSTMLTNASIGSQFVNLDNVRQNLFGVEDLESTKNIISGYSTAFDELAKSAGGVEKLPKSLQNYGNRVNEILQKMASEGDVNINDIRREFIELTETTSNSLQTTIQRTSSLINNIGRQLGIPPEVRTQIIENIRSFAEQYQAELDAKIKKDAKGKSILSGLNNFASSAKDFGTIATNSARAVTSLATAFTTLKGAFDTIKDPDMSTWEKMKAIFTATTSALISLSFAFNKNSVENLSNAGASMLNAGAKLLQKEATEEATKATQGLTASSWMAILPIMAAVAAVALLVVAINAIYKAANKERIEREKANKELQETRKLLEETTKAYDDLKTSIDNLSSAQDTLAGLTKGTKEWKEQVLKLNEQVLALVEKYPELADYMTSEDGVLGFEEGALDKILDSQLAQANAATLATQHATQKVQKVNKTQDIEKEYKNGLYYDRGGSPNYSAEQNLKPGTGIVDDATAEQQAILEGYQGHISMDQMKEIGKQLLAGAEANEIKGIDGLDTSTAEIQKAIEENAEAMMQLASDIAELDQQIINSNENIASTFLQQTGGITNPEMQDAYAAGMATEMQKNKEKFTKAIESRGKDDNVKTYAELTGMTEEDIKKKLKDKEDPLTEEAIEGYLIENAAATDAKKTVDKNLEELDKGLKDASVDNSAKQLVEKIVAAGGDVSTYNALADTQKEALVTALENPDVATAVNNVIGEGAAKSIADKLNDSEYNANRDKILEEKYNAELETAAKGLQTDKEGLESYVDYLTSTNTELKDNKELALEAAKSNLEYGKATKKVSETFDKYKEALETADEKTWEYHEAIGAVKKASKDMLGVDVSDDYIKDHLDDIKAASEGSTEAMVKLQQTAASDWGKDFVNELEKVEQKTDETGEKIIQEAFIPDEEWKSKFTDALDDVAQDLGSRDVTFNVDANTDKALDELIGLANEASKAGQMTQEQMQAMFNSMGYTPEITWETVPGPEIKSTTVSTVTDPNTGEPISFTTESTRTEEIAVPIIGDKDGDGKTTMVKTGGSNSLRASSAKSSSKDSGSKKDKKQSSDEIDRYHVIKETIEELNKDLDKLGKEKDRAFGGKKLKLMDQEISKLKELEKAQKEYNKQIEANYAKDKSAIAAYGAQFDENGVITNYEQLVQAQIDKFNKSRTDAAEEEYEKFKDTLSQYEETHDLLRDEKEKLIDLQNQIYDTALEKIDYKVELQIEINEDDLNYLEYLLGKIEDEAFNAAEAIALMGQQLTENVDNQKTYIEGLNEIFAGHGLGEDAVNDLIAGALKPENLKDMDFTEGEIDQIKGYKNSLLDINKTLLDLRKSVWEEVKETLEEINEKFEEQSEIVEHSASILEHYDNIIGLVGQDMLGISDAMKEAFGQAALDTAVDSLTISKEQVDALKDRKAEIEQELASTTDEATRKGLQASLDQINEDLRNAEDQMLSDWENALEKANEIFEEKVKTALKTFTDAMAGEFKNIETLQDQFEKTRELDNYFVDDYKKIYELSKLTRDINRSIDETDNIASKQALRDIQQEINDLQEAGVEMSQYDLDHLRAKYELRLAEIALEDAQNAKSQVRMTRDSEGNWSYTYTADQQNIDQATQNYEDKLYKIQELSSNYIKDVESQVIELSTAMAEEISAIDRTVYASEEEYNAEIQRITDFYQTKMAILSGEMTKAFDNNNVLYTQDWTNYSLATGYKISADKDFLTNFGETTAGILTGFTNMETYQSNFNKAIGSPTEGAGLLGSLAKAYSDWQSSVNRVMEAAGTSISGFGDKAKGACDKAKVAADNAAKSMKTLKEETDKAFKDALQAALDFEKDYDIDGIIRKNEAVVGSINKIIDGWKDASREQDNYNNKNNNSNQNNGSKNNSTGSGGGDKKLDKELTQSSSKEKIAVTLKKPYSTGQNTIYQPFNLGEYATIELAGKALKKTLQDMGLGPNDYFSKGNKYSTSGEKLDIKMGRLSIDNETKWKAIFATYDTGGYTGKWGPSGKIAMLHEKELVLNAQDTENMLKSIEMVRAIAKTIDLNAAATLGWGGLSSIGVGNGKQEIVQDITINAEFPNATDQNEIKAAFDNLFIRASQYANRK